MKKIVYVDHSATTYVKKEVLKSMLPYFSDNYGNPSSVYSIGRESKEAIDKSRETVSNVLNCNINEIYFTAGGSESDNLAILGIARANKSKGNHIITSKIEHLAVLNACKKLEEEGFNITYLDVDFNGRINLDELKSSITSNTILITIMYANNEIGTIQDIQGIGNIAKDNNVIFHTDAVQAIGNIKIDVEKLNISSLSMSAHKFYGPKGVGALYIKKGIKFEPVIHGGHQEKSKRAGTENVAGIVGLAKAIEIADQNLEEYNKKLISLRDYTINKILDKIPHTILNGDKVNRLPGNVNISFKAIEGESLLLMLDMKGICASSGSACTSGSLDPSHVLLAIGLQHEVAHGSLRITFGEQNTIEDADYIIDNLINIVDKLRLMSPIKL